MWVRYVREDEASGELAKHYKRLTRSWGGVDNIVRAGSLQVGAVDALLCFYRRVMHGKCEIPMAQREMIAVTVSSINECHY